MSLIVVLVTSVLLGLQGGPSLGAESVELYNLLQIEIENAKSYENPFDFNQVELRGTFLSPKGKKVGFYGFYDGDGKGGEKGDVWKIRFMPDQEGSWRYIYSWSDGTAGGSGTFNVTPRTNPKNHGQVRVDRSKQQYLVHADGTPHYWFGGAWLDSSVRDLCEGNSLIDYLDVLTKYRHNGILVTHSLFPLRDDRRSFDLKWLHCREYILKEAQQRGIYVQINFFDTWSRKFGSNETSTSGSDHVLNVWNTENLAEKEFYIRYLVARYASFSSVYWELGNEMEHAPNSGSKFVELANKYYIPWIRKYDPYDLPIGLSESVGLSADADIHFVHGDDRALPSTRPSKPWLKNEIVPGWQDEVIRDSRYRFYYRRVFWRMFAYGGSGSSEATWLDIRKPLTQPVRDVMADQMRLRNFIDSLSISINDMSSDSGIVRQGPGNFDRTRYKEGQEYVTYFYLEDKPGMLSRGQGYIGDIFRKVLRLKSDWPFRPLRRGNSAAAKEGTISVSLPGGTYKAVWYDPKIGKVLSTASVTSNSGLTVIRHPAFIEDIVMHLVRTDLVKKR